MKNTLLFSGSSNKELAQEIATHTGIHLGNIKIEMFPDQEISVTILESVEHKHVFVIQSIFPNPNIQLMELLIILDALKRAGAAFVTVVMPYYGYARQDRIDAKGKPITAKLVANLLASCGVQRIITMDLHSEQIEGFFDIPVEHILSRTLLIPYCKSLALDNPIIIAPDKGGIKIAVSYAKQLGYPVGLIEKARKDPFNVDIDYFVGSVEGHTVLLPDDMCSTGSTLIRAANACKDLGAKKVIAVIGHGLFIQDAIKKIEKSPIESIITTNSVSISEEIRFHPQIKILSVASLFANAIQS